MQIKSSNTKIYVYLIDSVHSDQFVEVRSDLSQKMLSRPTQFCDYSPQIDEFIALSTPSNTNLNSDLLYDFEGSVIGSPIPSTFKEPPKRPLPKFAKRIEEYFHKTPIREKLLKAETGQSFIPAKSLIETSHQHDNSKLECLTQKSQKNFKMNISFEEIVDQRSQFQPNEPLNSIANINSQQHYLIRKNNLKTSLSSILNCKISVNEDKSAQRHEKSKENFQTFEPIVDNYDPIVDTFKSQPQEKLPQLPEETFHFATQTPIQFEKQRIPTKEYNFSPRNDTHEENNFQFSQQKPKKYDKKLKNFFLPESIQFDFGYQSKQLDNVARRDCENDSNLNEIEANFYNTHVGNRQAEIESPQKELDFWEDEKGFKKITRIEELIQQRPTKNYSEFNKQIKKSSSKIVQAKVKRNRRDIEQNGVVDFDYHVDGEPPARRFSLYKILNLPKYYQRKEN